MTLNCVPLLGLERQRRLGARTFPIDAYLLQAFGRLPVAIFLRQTHAILGHKAPLLLAAWERAIGSRLNEGRNDVCNQAAPGDPPAGGAIKGPEALHRAYDTKRPVVGTSKTPSCEKVVFLGREVFKKFSPTLVVFVVIYIAELADGFGKSAARAGGVAANIREIVFEQLAKKPRKGWMNPIIATPLCSQETDLSGAVEQRDAALTCQAMHSIEAPISFWIAHKTQHVDINKAL